MNAACRRIRRRSAVLIRNDVPRIIRLIVQFQRVGEDKIVCALVRHRKVVIFAVPADAVAAHRPRVREPPVRSRTVRRGRVGIIRAAPCEHLGEIAELFPVHRNAVVEHFVDGIPRKVCGRDRAFEGRFFIFRIAVRLYFGIGTRTVQILFRNGNDIDALVFKGGKAVIIRHWIRAERYALQIGAFARHADAVFAHLFVNTEGLRIGLGNTLLGIIARVVRIIIGKIGKKPLDRPRFEVLVRHRKHVGRIDIKSRALYVLAVIAVDIYAVLDALSLVVIIDHVLHDAIFRNRRRVPETDRRLSFLRTAAAADKPKGHTACEQRTEHDRRKFAKFSHFSPLTDFFIYCNAVQNADSAVVRFVRQAQRSSRRYRERSVPLLSLRLTVVKPDRACSQYTSGEKRRGFEMLHHFTSI